MRLTRSVLFAAACIFLLFPVLSASGSWRTAPLNPEFLAQRTGESFNLHSMGGPGRRNTAQRRSLGEEPSPLDLSHVRAPVHFSGIRGGGDVSAAAVSFPSSFSLPTEGRMTPIRDQAPYGTCWAFGAFASLESFFAGQGEGNLDFSEWHLAYFAYVDEGEGLPGFTGNTDPHFGGDPIFDQGGNAWMSAALLARWTGAVTEADRPYQNVTPWPEESRPLSSDRAAKRLEHVLYLGSAPDMDSIKYALVHYGAVRIGVRWPWWDFEDQVLSPSFAFYNYDPVGFQSGGHAVAIAGWDDDFPAANFVRDPGRNGAWLVKNSWGEAWGNDGYFWVSYADPTLNSPSAYIGGEPDTFNSVYQYDPLGWVTGYGTGNETAWFANVFAASEGRSGLAEVLQAVSFYSAASESSYRIEIRRNVSRAAPFENAPVSVKEGVLGPSGYHTVRLDREVFLSPDSLFSVAVKITTPGYAFPVPLESFESGYSDKVEAEPGQSFISADGVSWNDLTALPGHEKSNVCLKAFTSFEETSGGGCSSRGEIGFAGLLLLLPLVPVLWRRGK